MGVCVWVWVMLKASVLTALNSVLHVLMQIASERRLPPYNKWVQH